MHNVKGLLLVALSMIVWGAGCKNDITAQNGNSQNGTVYTVKVTNLTGAQPWGKPVITTHDAQASLFQIGSPASLELTALAEEGDNAVMTAVLQRNTHFKEVVAGASPILPGQSQTFTIHGDDNFPLITIAGMLGTTNDTFAAAQAVVLPVNTTTTLTVGGTAFDAGTERNNERCAYIPGPPCNSHLARDPSGAEGAVRPSMGITGIGDLAAPQYGWTDPVLRIEITRAP